MNPPEEPLSQRYLRLWQAALPAIRQGKIEIDSVLASGIPDARRGLTLMARPCAEVRNRIGNFLAELREMEPDQYYYAPEALHVTILSLFTASEQHQRLDSARVAYEAAIESALKDIGTFEIPFKGITASPGAVLIQGFPQGNTLESI